MNISPNKSLNHIRSITPTHKSLLKDDDRIFKYTVRNRISKEESYDLANKTEQNIELKSDQMISPRIKRSKSTGVPKPVDKENKLNQTGRLSRERRQWNKEAYVEWKITSFSKSSDTEEETLANRRIIAQLTAEKLKLQAEQTSFQSTINSLNNLLEAQQLKLEEQNFKMKKIYEALKFCEKKIDEQKIEIGNYKSGIEELEKELQSAKLKMNDLAKVNSYKSAQERNDYQTLVTKYTSIVEELRNTDVWILQLLGLIGSRDLASAYDLGLGKRSLIEERIKLSDLELRQLRAELFFEQFKSAALPSNTPYLIPKSDNRKNEYYSIKKSGKGLVKRQKTKEVPKDTANSNVF
ncbi:unnamed protein product [Blepharisma stoltei]|uniref:Uncharacterized protein n=1 Tax=Blepharisma stoltei TaxID=1481888 RepID=A0AAU9JXL1_9CILI|nr:unnamed protein product [Blepharisma stoltei]